MAKKKSAATNGDEVVTMTPEDRAIYATDILGTQGVTMTPQEFQLLPDAQMRQTNKFCDDVAKGAQPPVPAFLLKWMTSDVRTKHVPKGMPARKLMDCEFGGVLFGDHTASVTCTVDSDRITDKQCGEILCGTYADVLIVLESGNSDGKQQQLPLGEAPPRIQTMMPIRRYSRSKKKTSFKLSFENNQVPGDVLREFAKHNGRIEIQVMGEDDDDHDDE